MKLSIPPKPEGAQWTDDQWKAITAIGMDILVAAAAGSGKTAVLVERIIRKVMDKDHPVDVDRLLIVTFTNAAAAEMRHRIGEALEKAISDNPASLHLRRQLSLLNRASISTLHSFCLEVIRRYYYLINIDPSFRIAEDTEAELLREEVMEELFEEEYGLEGNDAFFDLVDRYTGDRNDSDLQIMVRKLYDESRAHPNPTLWLQELGKAYEVDEQTSIDDLTFLSVIQREIQMQLSGAEAMLHQALELTRLPGGPAPRAVNLEEDLQQIRDLKEAFNTSWEAFYARIQSLKFSQLKTVKGDEYDEFLKEQVKDVREQAKNAVKQIKEDYFDRRPESYLKDLMKMKPSIKTLTELVLKFGKRYEKIKLEKSLVDFADLEHYCLNILREYKEGEGYVPSAAALYFKRHFNEILVDEYQDTNYVQESIIRSVCKDQPNPGNLFMVGDVKQSIYRFRLAEPGLFLEKYKLFSSDGNEHGLRIDLSQNFRSRAEVLDGTNYIFKQVMDEQVGEIAYDEQAELKLGASYPEHTDTKAELLMIHHDGVEQYESEDETGFDPVELETVQLEARLMAKNIKEMINQGYQVYDRKLGANRNITYRDIVILLRSMPWAPQIMDEFKLHGIPVYADLSSGYFEATEVSIMLSLLKVIDNPYQDIPLAAVLRSPIVGLDAHELAYIRLQDKKSSFYEAVKAFLKTGVESSSYSQTYEKLTEFHLLLQKWRKYARLGSLSELIWRIYQKTGYYDFVGGMAGGKQRQANLRALYDRARQYESTSFRGLFRFLRFIERMQDRGDDLGTARALGEQEDVVRIMTIHKSKGLEFPVVFVAGLSKPFNVRDLNSTFLLHKDLGFGSKYIDPTLRISYPTLPQLAIRQKMRNEMLAEEMRVLYVALTRAKEKLYLVGTVKKLEKKLEQWSSQLSNKEWLLPSFDRSKGKCYMDWVAPALIRHQDAELLRQGQLLPDNLEKISTHPSRWKLSLIDPSQLELVEEGASSIDEVLITALKKGEKVPVESEWKATIEERLSWEYPFKTASVHRSKQSVSEIKRMREVHDAYSETTLVKTLKKPITDRPRFLQEKSLTPAEKGTAMHMVMQHIPVDQAVTEERVRELLAYMVVNELLTEEQSNHINVNGIVTFFKTEIGQRILKAENVMREVPFSIGLPSNEVYPDWKGDTETILLQGVIDLLFEDEQGSVLLDFKTDVTTGKLPKDTSNLKQILKERYEVQVELYSKAIEQIWKQPLQEKYLYFFDGEHLVRV